VGRRTDTKGPAADTLVGRPAPEDVRCRADARRLAHNKRTLRQLHAAPSTRTVEALVCVVHAHASNVKGAMQQVCPPTLPRLARHTPSHADCCPAFSCRWKARVRQRGQDASSLLGCSCYRMRLLTGVHGSGYQDSRLQQLRRELTSTPPRLAALPLWPHGDVSTPRDAPVGTADRRPEPDPMLSAGAVSIILLSSSFASFNSRCLGPPHPKAPHPDTDHRAGRKRKRRKGVRRKHVRGRAGGREEGKKGEEGWRGGVGGGDRGRGREGHAKQT